MKTTVIIGEKDIDSLGALALNERLEQLPSDTKVSIDVRNVERMSIAALGVLVWAAITFKKITIIGANASIVYKMTVLGINQLIKIV